MQKSKMVALNLQKCSGAMAKKTTLLQTLVCRAGLQRFANVLFCGRGFLFLCLGGEKKQNKFPSNCTSLSTEHQSSQSVFVIISIFFYRINVSSWFSTLAYNARGYETCRIAEMPLYPTIQNLMRDEMLVNPLKPACFMTRCWAVFLFKVYLLKLIRYILFNLNIGMLSSKQIIFTN